MAEFDVAEASDRMATELFSEESNDETIVDDNPVSEETVNEAEPKKIEDEAVQPVVQARKPPQSWSKDKHELWSKLPPEAQDYYEHREKQMLDGLGQYKEHSELGKQIKEVVTPYKAFLQAQGVDEVKAVSYLLNAHYRLTQGTPEQRLAAYKQLGTNLGFHNEEGQQVDHNTRALQERIDRLELELNSAKDVSINETRTRVAREVEAFAKDHPYFDEVADQIAIFVQSGVALQEAYDQAVWANPVTRAKELARTQTENEKALKEKAEKEAAAARKASSTNVRTRDTSRTPTENRGKLFGPEHEQEMRSIVKGERAH
jgi:hypothetical protein